MTAFFFEYGLFFAKSLTVVVSVILVIAAITALKHSQDADDTLQIHSLNEYYENQRERLYEEILDKKSLKAQRKEQKKAAKAKEEQQKPRIFILDFDGDIEASAVTQLREHISAVIQVANQEDRVLLRLESGGGLVHAYGLASSQLARLRDKQIPLTICVDKVAASGGYMMACLADELIAAPFAILGSVGVVGALPNFNELLKQHHIRYEQHTAGEHKRSLTLFGENTDADRRQFCHELNMTHDLFKNHIKHYRPQLDIDAIATGETWYGTQAIENYLIDAVGTSDDYILAHLHSHHLVQLEEAVTQGWLEKLKQRFLGKIYTHPATTRIH
ncbi:MAG: protease SohB [Cardiobacteriaceae bacterium]|nr:protease SohB [Cardiobacteriaceae bacterium]